MVKSLKYIMLFMALCILFSSVAYAFVYQTGTQSLTQTIKNKPYYYVNQVSNVDSSADKGTHSNFTAQRYGPDSVYDALAEQEGSATFGKTGIGVTPLGYTGFLEASRYQCGQAGSVKKITLYLSGGAAGRYARVAIYSDNSGAPSSLLGQSSQQEISSNGWYNFTGFNVPVSKNAYYWLAFQMSTGNLKFHYDTGVANQHAYRAYTYGAFPSSFGTPSYGVEAQSIYATTSDGNYQLDLEVQWTNADFHEVNEQLCIYGGVMGSENLRVDVWTGSSWQNVFANLAAGWNNATVSAYLVSSTLTIRFKGSIETSDATQDSWTVDAALLHLWS